MNYTESPQRVVHPGTGHPMHEDNQALPTVLSDVDINQLTWGVMEVLAAGGIAPSTFDPGVPATYTALRDAIAAMAQKGYGFSAVSGGGADAITATFAPAISALTNGTKVCVRATSANTTTTPTFAANGTAAKTIVKGNGLALSAGDIAGSGHWIELQFDTVLDKWVLLNPATGVLTFQRSQLLAGQTTTSGVAVDFTGIPAWAKKITVMYQGVSLSGAGYVILRLGTSAGFLTSGYAGSSGFVNDNNGTAVTNTANGIGMSLNNSAVDTRHGQTTLVHMGSNSWCGTSISGLANVPSIGVAGGSVSLPGVLDRIRITSSTGTDTFDGGAVNLLIEG